MLWEHLGMSFGDVIIVLLGLYFVIKHGVKNGIKQYFQEKEKEQEEQMKKQLSDYNKEDNIET